MTDEEAVETLKFISASWSDFNIACGPEIIRAFRCHFHEVPFEVVIMAITYVMRTKEKPYPPSWAEIWKAIRSLKMEVTPDSAFDEMLSIAGRLGHRRGEARIKRKSWSKIGLRFFKEVCYTEEKYIGLLRERFRTSFELDQKEEVLEEVRVALEGFDRLKALEFRNHKKLLALQGDSIGKNGKEEI